MANGLLAHLNRVDLDGAGLTTDSQVLSLPITNLADPVVQKKWRTAAATTAFFQIDFGAAVDIDVLAVAGLNIAAADTVRHRLSAVAAGDGELLDTGAVASGVAEGYGLARHILSATVQARWWRCDIVAPSLSPSPGYIEAGRAWAGPAWRFGRPFNFGWGDDWVDPSNVQETEQSGAEWVDRRTPFRVVDFVLSHLSASDRASAKEVKRVAGARGQVFFAPFPDGDDWATEDILGRIRRSEPIRHRRLTRWQTSFVIEQSR